MSGTTSSGTNPLVVRLLLLVGGGGRWLTQADRLPPGLPIIPHLVVMYWEHIFWSSYSKSMTAIHHSILHYPVTFNLDKLNFKRYSRLQRFLVACILYRLDLYYNINTFETINTVPQGGGMRVCTHYTVHSHAHICFYLVTDPQGQG